MPTRSCVICRKKEQKEKLLRIVSIENNEALLDENQILEEYIFVMIKNVLENL